MYTVINAANDLWELDKIGVIGPTVAIVPEEDLVFNHQTSYTYQLLQPKVAQDKETEAVKAFLVGKDVVICLNVNGMFEDYVETWDEVAELEEDEDWYLEGTVIDVRPGQLRLETDEDESEWIPFKHIDTIEISDGSSDEPYQVYSEDSEEEE